MSDVIAMIGYIYKITCKTSGRMYIGVAVNVVARWKAHARADGSSPCLHQAIRLRGPWAFEWQIVEVLRAATARDLRRILLAREREYILALDTYYPSGFNLVE